METADVQTSLYVHPSKNITFTIKTMLPTYLLPSYWLRHRLSKHDVTRILHGTSCKHTWLLAIMMGI